MTLALGRLAGTGVTLNASGIRELLWVLQRALHTTDEGADLPLREFSSVNVGRKILGGLVRCGLIVCFDLDSWKPTDYNFKNAKARRYLPTSELLLADAGLNVVASAADYLEGRFTSRNLTTSSSVQVNNSSGVTIPPLVISKLDAGTGFGFNLESAIPNLDELPEEKKIHFLRSGQQALTCLGNSGPLHAEWSQKESGRLYARKPALLSLPKPLRVGLLAPDEGHVASVDFNSFEFRILCCETGVEAPQTDCAAFIGRNVQLDRKAVKRVVNPMLHGQTEENLFGPRNRQALEDRRKVEEFLRVTWPRLLAKIDSLRENKDFLQRRGAEVFFSCYAEALGQIESPAGIPMHDGWVFSARDEIHATKVRDIFTKVGSDLLGQSVLVTHEPLN